MFYSSTEKKLVTLKEYTERMKEEQKDIYYACGETVDKIDMLPQVESVKDKGYEILYFTENVDEFVVQTLREYNDKKFVNICTNELDLDTEEEKAKLKEENEKNKDMFEEMKNALKDEVQVVRFTNKLKNHPVCLTSEGAITLEMEKVINAMPTDQNIKAQKVLEVNAEHPIAAKLKELYEKDKTLLDEYTKVLYSQARLIEGMTIENPTEISNIICDILSK